MDLTPLQLQYLLWLGNQTRSMATQIRAASFFDVVKVTAFRAFERLQEKNFVSKRGRTLCLTYKGNKVYNLLHQPLVDLSMWMSEEISVPEDQVQHAALMMLCNNAFIPEALSRIVDYAIRMRVEHYAEAYTSHEFMRDLENGVYQIPFSVHKDVDNSVSMGDRGFCKPCDLVVNHGSAAFVLRSKVIRHRSVIGKILRGSLKHLWYQRDGEWLEARYLNDGSWVIPVDIMKVDKIENRLVGIIPIRACPTCNFPIMAEHKANLQIDLSQCHKPVDIGEALAEMLQSFDSHKPEKDTNYSEWRNQDIC